MSLPEHKEIWNQKYFKFITIFFSHYIANMYTLFTFFFNTSSSFYIYIFSTSSSILSFIQGYIMSILPTKTLDVTIDNIIRFLQDVVEAVSSKKSSN